MIKSRAQRVFYYTSLVITISYVGPLLGKNTLDEQGGKPPQTKQVTIGNFALPTSQQPGPLIGFGQNILDKGDLQVFTYADFLKGKRKQFTEVAPSILYAITDRSSVFVELPIAAQFRLNNTQSHGLEDLLVQFEYALYDKNTLTTASQITAVAALGLPTGDSFKVPYTGFGAPSFFLGFTISHTRTDWYFFMSYAVVLPTAHKDTKFGNQVVYQWGLSKNIWYCPDKWIFNWMIELDGAYRERNRLVGAVDQNSGGNDLFFGPSLWFSTQRLIVQGGISWAIVQRLFGMQNEDKYSAAVNFGWKF